MIVSTRACRHCGSPAKGNPCWWGIKTRNWCADPPCVVPDRANESYAYLARQPSIAIAAYISTALVIIAALIFWFI